MTAMTNAGILGVMGESLAVLLNCGYTETAELQRQAIAAVDEIMKQRDALLKASEKPLDRGKIMEGAEFLAACYSLKELVEDSRGYRWVKQNGMRLKDTTEWCNFYVQVNKIHRGEIAPPPTNSTDIKGGEDGQE